MTIDRMGATYMHEGICFRIGTRVYANSESDYEGLYSRIVEIRDGEDKGTDNEGPDVYCAFEIPTDPVFRRILEQRFSELYGYTKTLEDLGIDWVIMAADMLDLLPEN